MSRGIPDGKTRLLFVEGKTDKEFFIQLGFHLGFTAETPLHIIEYGGKDNLQDFLALAQAESNFKHITHIGIVRDADFTDGAFQSVRRAIESANRENPTRKQYPIPERPLVYLEVDLQMGVYLMPDATSEGMLESLILTVLGEDEIMRCVHQYFDCVEATGVDLKPEPLPKALMRVYMAALYQGKIRTFIEGKNIDFETASDDRDKSYLSDIYKMSWWTWDHPAFDEIKAFLRELVS